MSKQKKATDYSPPHDALWFLPLGGSGEIGMNLNLYGTGGKWLMIDCGVSFGDDTTPGIDLLMPDISFIEARRDDLVGIVVTHAHEDHYGALSHLWHKLQCPIYATPFTAGLIRARLVEADLQGKAR
ncbi:MAG: MBL fold metallo-hydrolase, partial [Alphaproteobacteria bacterium]|nr:MBL fold metallo-hydrolase [Alphaproteobacteria bacterium]